MSLRFWRGAFVVASAIAISCFALAATELPAIGANALLHPARRPLTIPTPEGCVTRKVAAVGAMLTGWICDGRAPRRGTLVYLHGVADNRESAVAIIRRFVPRGLTVVAFDSRAHGDSTGAACTYGYYEQDDLHRILDTVVGPIVLVGNSLGGAVALQEAAHDSRVQAIVAMAPFSDLRTIAAERALPRLPPATSLCRCCLFMAQRMSTRHLHTPNEFWRGSRDQSTYCLPQALDTTARCQTTCGTRSIAGSSATHGHGSDCRRLRK